MYPVGYHPGELDLKIGGGIRHSVGTVLGTDKINSACLFKYMCLFSKRVSKNYACFIRFVSKVDSN
jgi:hypothetical protein